MGIRFGVFDVGACIDRLVKICLSHPNEVYIGTTEGKETFISIDNAWEDQQAFLREGFKEAVLLKDYYESMYADVSSQKRLLCAVVDLFSIVIDCKIQVINISYARAIFNKWRVTNVLTTEMLENLLIKYGLFPSSFRIET